VDRHNCGVGEKGEGVNGGNADDIGVLGVGCDRCNGRSHITVIDEVMQAVMKVVEVGVGYGSDGGDGRGISE